MSSAIEQEKLPFDQWFEDNDSEVIDVDAYECAKAAWYAALRWVAEDQPVSAWQCETDERVITDKTRNNPLFKATRATFNVPLFKHPHHATKYRRNLSEDN